MDAATVEELHAEYLAAKERNRVLTERYNREYKAGKWSTNRPLAGRCEDAYSEEYRAMRAWEAARDAAEDDAAIDPAEDLQDAVTYTVTAGDVTVTVYESLDSAGRIVIDIDAPAGTDLAATVNDGYVFNALVPA